MKRFFLLLLCTFACLPWHLAAIEPFPENFPEELKTKKFREKDVKELAPGIMYYHYHFDNVLPEGFGKEFPLSVYYVIIDWNKANVELKIATCRKKLQTVEDMVKRKRPLAAVNGAYFVWKSKRSGKPEVWFPLKVDGKYFDPEPGYDSKTGIGFNSDGSFPFIITEDRLDTVKNAIFGYLILKDGKNMLDLQPDENPWKDVAKGDTPLTALGLNPEKKLLVFMVCDGRFHKDSPGMNFFSESFFLKIVGCTDVISFDGGGSSTMLIRDKGRLKLVNHPSDNHKFDHKGARRVHDCIYIVKSKKAKTAPALSEKAVKNMPDMKKPAARMDGNGTKIGGEESNGSGKN